MSPQAKRWWSDFAGVAFKSLLGITLALITWIGQTALAKLESIDDKLSELREADAAEHATFKANDLVQSAFNNKIDWRVRALEMRHNEQQPEQ